MVEAPEPDEDGEAVTTMVVDWVPAPAGTVQNAQDPWARSRRQGQRTTILRLKRLLMDSLATDGMELPIPPDGQVARMIAQEIVRERFYAGTRAEGTPTQKAEVRRKSFNRAIDWAEDQQLIAVQEI